MAKKVPVVGGIMQAGEDTKAMYKDGGPKKLDDVTDIVKQLPGTGTITDMM